MLTKTVKTTKQVAVKVEKFKWFKPVGKDSKLEGLRCTACRKTIGNKRWGLAWTLNDRGQNVPMRLCNDCGENAEQALKGGTDANAKDNS